MESYKILLADDHPMICAGIASILEKQNKYVVDKVLDNGVAALDYIKNEQPDIAVLDIEMGDMTGLDVAREIAKLNVRTKIIILTMHRDKAMLLDALDLNVQGYITKDVIQDEILRCLDTVANARQYITPGIFEKDDEISDYMHNMNAIRLAYGHLTKSEKNIITLINKGFSTNEIAERLFVSAKTVENHRSNICKKLNITGHNALVRWVLENSTLISLIRVAS